MPCTNCNCINCTRINCQQLNQAALDQKAMEIFNLIDALQEQAVEYKLNVYVSGIGTYYGADTYPSWDRDNSGGWSSSTC